MTLIIETLKNRLQTLDNDPLAFVDVMNELSWQYLIRDANVGRLFAEQAETIALEHNYRQGIVDSQRNQAYGLYHSGHYRKAIELAHDLITQYIQLEDYRGLAQSHSLIGLCEVAVSNYAEALEYHLKALEFARHLQQNDLISASYNNIARVYAATEKYNAAIEHYQDAITLLIASENEPGLADVYNNLAMLYNEQGKYDDALDYARRAISICESLRYDVGLAQVYNTIGTIYTNWSHYGEAQEYLVQSREKASHNTWLAIELQSLHQLARLHIKMTDMIGAISYLEQAATRADMLGQVDRQAQIYLDFATVYKMMEDYELALQYHEMYHELYRQRFAEERDAKLRSLEIAHKTKTARTEAEFQRERAEQLEQRREEDRLYFERLNTMRDEFLHSTTHDLKNPLATIKTHIYLIRKMITHPKALEYVKRIEAQAERMNTLISDMLELAKLETGRALSLAQSSLADLILTVLDEAQPVAASRSIEMTFDNLADRTIINIDYSLMQRVFSNLVSNAIKYTDDGGSVSVRIDMQDSHFIITVSDTGVGIPAEALPHIFDTFYRVEASQSRSVEGTGLGLAIVSKIIDQHGGTIYVESEAGVGTSFVIELPATG